MYNVQRVQCADGAPIAIMENYLVADMFPNFHTGYADFISLYATLEPTWLRGGFSVFGSHYAPQ